MSSSFPSKTFALVFLAILEDDLKWKTLKYNLTVGCPYLFQMNKIHIYMEQASISFSLIVGRFLQEEEWKC